MRWQDILRDQELEEGLQFEVVELFLLYQDVRIFTYPEDPEDWLHLFRKGTLAVYLVVVAITEYYLRDYLWCLQLLYQLVIPENDTSVENLRIFLHDLVDQLDLNGTRWLISDLLDLLRGLRVHCQGRLWLVIR